MNSEITEFVSYIRISVADNNRAMSLGAEAQIADIDSFIKANPDKKIVRQFVEDGASGASIDNRPVFNELLAYLKKNRNCGLIVKNITRLSRNIADVVRLVSGELKNRRIISLDMPDIDFGTSNGFFVLLTFANFAEYERRQISERTKSALSVLKSKGVRLGNPNLKSYGQNETENNVLSIVRAMSESGYGPSSIARALNARGMVNRANKAWSPASVSNLRNRL